MNRDFLSNFEKREIKAASTSAQSSNDGADDINSAEFKDDEYTVAVCFVWPEGRRKFYPYSRLDSGEINSENNSIHLSFGAENVELIGLRLLPLFEALMNYKKKLVYCDDARYNEINDDEIPIVNEINITSAL